MSGVQQTDRRRYHRFKKPCLANNPVVTFLFREIDRQKLSAAEVSKRAGLHPYTIGRWRRYNGASLENIQAALNVLGYEIDVRPRRIR